MKYQENIDYPVSAERLIQHITDPAFAVRKHTLQGATGISIESQRQDGNTYEMTVLRQVPVEVDVPNFARSLVPATITLRQTERWDISTQRGTLDIIFVGMPVKVTCNMSLTDIATGVREVLDFDLKVSVPIIGGKLEALLAQDFQLKFRRDTEATRTILSELA